MSPRQLMLIKTIPVFLGFSSLFFFLSFFFFFSSTVLFFFLFFLTIQILKL